MENINIEEPIRRGDIYLFNLDRYRPVDTQLERGTNRPVVVISSEAGNKSSNLVNVVPFTTKLKSLAINVGVKPLRPGLDTQVLCNQIYTVQKKDLGKHIGCLDEEDLANVDRGILIALGLYTFGGASRSGIAEVEEELEKKLSEAREFQRAMCLLISKAEKLKGGYYD